jgi:EmrB/QacA subfamily drug resistance transporter
VITNLTRATVDRTIERSEAPDSPRRKWWVLSVLAIAQLMVVLDVTIVNIALPAAQADLGFSTDSRQWVITAYSLAFGGLLILGGRIGDRFGRRGAFMVGAAGFAAASVVGGLSTSFTMLIGARALQGAFGALMAPAALSLLSVTFAGSPQRSKAFGIWGATTGAGGAIGLLLGGVLTEYLSWRWCLLVNVGFAAVALLGGLKLLRPSSDPARPSINAPSAVLISGGLFGLVYGLSRAETSGWADRLTLISLAVGALLVVGFVLLQARMREPLLPLRVVRDRRRAGSLIAIFLTGAGVFGVFLFLTFYLQQILGFSAVTTGLAFLPMVAVLGVVAAETGARLLARTGPRPLVVVGALCAGGAMVWLTGLQATSAYSPSVLVPLMLAGVGCGLIFAAATGSATLGLRPGDAGVGSALVSTAQQIGGAVGTALLSTQATRAGDDKVTELLRSARLPHPTPQILEQASISGYHAAFWWAGGFFALAAVLCFLLTPHGPAPAQDDDALPALG